jgi:hypothetical protein
MSLRHKAVPSRRSLKELVPDLMRQLSPRPLPARTRAGPLPAGFPGRGCGPGRTEGPGPAGPGCP